jgi:hypothetical protein
MNYDKTDQGQGPMSPTKGRQMSPTATPGGLRPQSPDRANDGEGFEFINDYSSSDYDYISDDEIEHMM